MAIKRVLLKVSGEALAAQNGYGIDPDTIDRVVVDVAEAVQAGLQLGIVIGGGNIFRGVSRSAAGMDRATADYMGMLATVMNALALHDSLERHGLAARVMSALRIDGIAEPFVRRRALNHLEKSRVVVFAGGTGNPYFTTDTAACVRAIDIQADMLLKATKVDGVYDADPVREPAARRYERLGFRQVIADDLQVMDIAAIVLCRDHGLPIRVFDLDARGALTRIFRGESVGTLIC
ncbi:MAG: UMP kinase [Pseudomonadota bacterium]|nr:UMP kinase [Pseudomonadota bacterium]